jgi:pre-rRNA-processing protein IPI1
MGKAKKQKDFQKVKLKIGKKKPLKDNETKTTFKSQAVVVPEQSISENKGEPTTSRNSTLKELLAHSKHYNPHVRKEAIHGLKEMFGKHPQNVLVHLSSIFEITFAIIVDEDSSVRAAYLGFLQSITPHLSKNNVGPFIALYLSYCGSAMTHIDDNIRLNSLDFLNLWINAFPSLIVNSTVQILPNFIGLLSNFAHKGGSQSSNTPSKLISLPNSKMANSKSRTSILQSLYIYLSHALESEKAAKSWFDEFIEVSNVDAAPTFKWQPDHEFEIDLKFKSGVLEFKPLSIFQKSTASLNIFEDEEEEEGEEKGKVNWFQELK